jgi:hypothetical protein
MFEEHYCVAAVAAASTVGGHCGSGDLAKNPQWIFENATNGVADGRKSCVQK